MHTGVLKALSLLHQSHLCWWDFTDNRNNVPVFENTFSHQCVKCSEYHITIKTPELALCSHWGCCWKNFNNVLSVLLLTTASQSSLNRDTLWLRSAGLKKHHSPDYLLGTQVYVLGYRPRWAPLRLTAQLWGWPPLLWYVLSPAIHLIIINLPVSGVTTSKPARCFSWVQYVRVFEVICVPTGNVYHITINVHWACALRRGKVGVDIHTAVGLAGSSNVVGL